MGRTRTLANASWPRLSAVLVLLWFLAGAALAQQDPADPDWSSRVSRDIAESEYHVTWQPETVLADVPAAWQAPNRAQGFRTYFVDRGIRVVPRVAGPPAWEWSLSLVGYGRGGTVWGVPDARPAPSGNRVEYCRGALREWYVNDARGLEQGFVLPAAPETFASWTGAPGIMGPPAPPGRGRALARGDLIHLDFALLGDLSARVNEGGLVVDFVTAQGARAVRYADLVVRDANARVLPAWIEGLTLTVGGGIRIVVDARDAAWPIEVDPLATSPSWTAEGDQAAAMFGASVSSAGDVNGDGHSDVIVGAPQYDNGQTDEGRALLYLGSASGLATSPAWTAEGDQAAALFGGSVSSAGDVNGDGYADVIIGAYSYDNGGLTDAGRAFLYLGSASGLAASPAWTADGDRPGAFFGSSVASAGDVNGDGDADVIVSARGYGNGQTGEGAAFLYLGSASGLGSSPAWSLEGNQAEAHYGDSVAGAGDVNGDGYADVIVGAGGYSNDQQREGRAFLYLGSAAGLATSAAWTAESNQAEAFFGYSSASAGDVNGDGYADVVIGAYGYDNGQTDEGRAHVYLGSVSGLASAAAWTTESDQANALFGRSVASAGDINGDGYADVIVGAPSYDNGQTDEGRAYVYFGSAAGLATSAAWTQEGDQASAQYGFSVASAGDVNGDGYADAIVGARSYDNGQTDEGRAFVYLGAASGPAATYGWSAESNRAASLFGYPVANAGDVNGDGHADVIVGAHLYDNGQAAEGRAYVFFGSPSGLGLTPWTAESDQVGAMFGYFAAGAGDVNGDGYDDVIVGSRTWANDHAGEGGAFLWYGSASGLGPPGTPANADWYAESHQSYANFGISSSGVGDVNGDGYGDVCVGAWTYDNDQVNEGKAFCWYGSAIGLGDPGTPANADWTNEIHQAEAFFGKSYPAGDVNGDGYDDVLVGAYGYDHPETNEGGAFLYYGSASGLQPSPAWTAESNQAEACLGWFFSSAGDVNGDSYADVLIGAYHYSDPEPNEGAAFAWYGSASGLGEPGTPANADWHAESDQSGAEFTYSVRYGGDVNGDGYADIVVGALYYDNDQVDEGRAYVYLGSASGLAVSPAWTAEGNQTNAAFGCHVAGADVNGDGYSDVIVGANLYDNVEIDEGRVFVYYGNSGAGLSLAPQQRRADDTAPIAQNGRSFTPGQFRLASVGRTPFGAGRVKLEWEVKPLGTLFDGSATERSAEWSATGSGGAALNEVVHAPDGGSYHWRLRLLYDPASSPLAQRSRWFAVPTWGGWNQTDLDVEPCSVPDQAVYIYSVRRDADDRPILDIRDPNASGKVTGYNVYRSSSPAAAWPWPLVASNATDMDPATPDVQWVDESGDPGDWFYLVNAYNATCKAEGPR